MLDRIGRTAADSATEAINDQMRTLYRARPFTKAVPFNNILGVDPVPLWEPANAYFEVAAVLIRGDMVGVDLSLVDSTVAQPLMFIMPPTTEYILYRIDPGYRSLLSNNARLMIYDPSNSGITIKGVIYGWEVTDRGYYR